jgi:hypothetical protein
MTKIKRLNNQLLLSRFKFVYSVSYFILLTLITINEIG